MSVKAGFELGRDYKPDLVASALRSGGTIRIKVLGTSMLPTVWPGDVLVIENRRAEEFVAGDIALILRDRRFFVHRLVSKAEGTGGLMRWIARGDSMPQSDPPLKASELRGKVAEIQRGHRIIVPKRQRPPLHRVLAWMLCHCDPMRSLALRAHLAWPRTAPGPWGDQRDVPDSPVGPESFGEPKADPGQKPQGLKRLRKFFRIFVFRGRDGSNYPDSRN